MNRPVLARLACGALGALALCAAGRGQNRIFHGFPAMNLEDAYVVPDRAQYGEAATKIRTVVADLPSIKGRSFLIQPLDRRKTADWDYAAVSAQVEDALTRQGMAPAAPGRRPDYVVRVDYASARTFAFDKFFVFVVTNVGKRIYYEAVIATSKPDSELSDVLPSLVTTFFQNFPAARAGGHVVRLAAD